ncbi:MAG: SDR family oxidoreductase [Rhodobacteraceae bacterium]|nr:SDR family oxidoreductase [Paracoccaceae bacterium]MCP5342422.1 SDR family oxidoreductase [Paracoccaceae bacterium]
MSLNIAGKTAIVTGAANGIGLAIARHFVDCGAKVMFADSDEARLSAEISEEAGDDSPIRYFGGDLSQKLTLTNLLSATVDAFERIDILVNASRQVATSDPLDPDNEMLNSLLSKNLMSTLRLSQMAARRMIAQAEKDGQEEGQVGSIINFSTLAAVRAQPELLAYSVTGAAVEQATRSLAVVLAPHRIRVNGISVASMMSASMQATLKTNPEWREPITSGTPMGRIASASELADTVQFLASEGSGFMTGQILTVDGGRSLIDAVSEPAY